HRDTPILATLFEDEALAEGGRDGDELGMDGGTVEALVVVLDEDLPVGLQLRHGLPRGAQLVHLPRLVHQRLVALRLELVADTILGRAEVDEHEPLPHVDLHRPEREGRAVELVLADERRADQLPVVRIAPGVVRTLDRALRVPVRLGVADPTAAMAAHVVETVELPVLAADDEDALADDVDREEVPRLGRLVGASGVEPLPEEDLFALELEDLGSVVVAAGKSRATGARHGQYVTIVTLHRRPKL